METQITRSANIVVDSVDNDDYGNLLFTDKEGAEYKVSQKRAHFFEGIIVPDVAVKLNYAVYMKKEYIYDAIRIKDQLPQDTQKEEAPKVTPSAPKVKPPVTPQEEQEMTKEDWAEKNRITRKSIERQTALKAAVEVAKIFGADSTEKVISIAKKFEAYLEV